MYPRAFAYTRASGVDEAVALLARYGEDARPLAGGMSLVPWLKYRQRSPRLVVDIGRLEELAGIRVDDGAVHVGATTRHATVAAWRDDPALGLLPDLAARIGDVQVRNMGTVGGGLAAVEPTGDWGAALLAMRGEVTARSSTGQRRIAADDLFLDTYRSALRPDELLTTAVFPVPSGRFGTAAAKLDVRAAAAPLLSCAVHVELDGDDRVSTAGVACVGLTGRPVRLTDVEAALRGEPLTAASVDSAAEATKGNGADPFRASALGRLVRDALRVAGERAQQVRVGADT